MDAPKRGPGRPKGSGDPDAAQRESIRLRPSERAALDIKDPRGWRARISHLIASDLA